ncbi:hypothetical protein BCR35DRAFT_296765 [Leucosporidium creatinivorum]|uniref:Polynucleotide 5'-hydroxyl-kinase GRC3 n=1 Tax=Leucosporidium creatinivorum TaxID=106004 RepID=A0A1Y2D4C5_9BASI|nr:hypothetical protein BCR35DRAFT_296765 [Leucosporidium creatinivorum]
MATAPLQGKPAQLNKRTRTDSPPSVQPTTQLASNSSMNSPTPPLSAVAARKAALAAQAKIIDPPIHSIDSDNDSDDDVVQQVLADALADPQGQQDAAPAKLKRPRPAKPTKGKGAGRYFAGTADEDSERPSTRPTSGASTEIEVEGAESFEEAARTAGKGKLGRGKRQRREKSAFLDPVCFSSFAPSAGTNAFRVELPSSEGEQRNAAVFCLMTAETLIIHGSYRLTPIFGSTSILGSILTPPPSDASSLSLSAASATAHRVFSPSSHPLPPLEALPPSFASSSTSPSTLSLPGGSLVSLTAFSSVVLVEELGAEIEGVETVLRSSGMGCGNAMWQVEDTFGRSEHWGGAGWRLILEPTPSLTSLRPLESWESTLASFGYRGRTANARSFDDEEEEEEEEEEELAAGAERLVLLVEGPKRVGKSTFTKLLLNRLLYRYETVAYLDTDLGQPEFTTPGFVSLNVVREPVLGPSFTHLSLPISSHFLGTTSPASDPSAYLAAISSLLATFSLDVEYPLTDEAPRRRGAAAASSRTSSKIRDRVPLIINTQGWVKGLGADLLAKLKAEARPTHVVSFEPAEESTEGGWSGQEQMAPPPPEYQDPSCQVIRLVGAPSSPLDSKWSAADLRTLSLISYFHAVFPRDPTPSDVPRTNTFPTAWDFSTPLVSQTPFTVDWTASRKQIKGVHLLDSDVPYEQVLYALNGSVVALLEEIESINQLEEAMPPSAPSAQAHAFPLLYLPPPPTSTRSLGLALIRSIDPTTQTLHLLTPVHSSHLAASPLTLVKGAIDLPLPLLLDFKAGEMELNKGVCGTEWKDVPYLTVEEGEQGRKKVRRNLMRRGQN